MLDYWSIMSLNFTSLYLRPNQFVKSSEKIDLVIFIVGSFQLTAQKIELTEENEEKLKCLQKEYDSKHALSQKTSEDEKKELKERLEQTQQEVN